MARRHFVRDLQQLDRLAPHVEFVPVHAREVEQVADEPLEAPPLDEDRLRRSLGREGAVGKSFRVTSDRGQRRLQLVADREQEAPFRLA